MKRWLPWLAIPLVLSVLVLMNRAQGSALLQDSDTRVLLENIQERGNPWSWFAGDWPLFNHFYRPISTLFFEMDLSVYGMNAAGFGMTNALISGICIWLAFWVGRELTDHPLTAGLATLVFGVAHLGTETLSKIFSLFWILSFVALLGFGRGKFKDRVWPVALAVLSCAFLATLVPGPLEFKSRIVDWLPGRTASVMAIFALVSVGAYARFERLTAGVRSTEPTSMDLPATKGTTVTSVGRFAWGWVAVSLVGLLLALGAYEQAVILPGLITGVMIMFTLQGRRVHWANLVPFWGVLIAYLVFRNAVVPSEVSGYQAQQFRSGIGVYLDLARYLAPGLTEIQPLTGSLEIGVFAILMGGVWAAMAGLFGNVASVVGIWKDSKRWLGIGLLLMGFVAFLPMAWLKFFAHYHYFPAVFYSLFVVVLMQMVLKWVVEALSPGQVMAPVR